MSNAKVKEGKEVTETLNESTTRKWRIGPFIEKIKYSRYQVTNLETGEKFQC